MPLTTPSLQEIVAEAARVIGIDGSNGILLRDGSNAMFRLPEGVIARVAQPGRRTVAERETRVARWLADHGVSVTRPLAEVQQPTVVDDRAVTWWHALPPHRQGR